MVRTIPSVRLLGVDYRECNINDAKLMKNILSDIEPDEIYNLAAQSDATISINNPEDTMLTNANSVMALSNFIDKSTHKIKMFQAGSMEMFKGVNVETVDERNLSFYPLNPYAIAKLAAYWTTRYYREQKQRFICTGIIFHAESKLRGEKFVTQKIARGARMAISDPNYVMEIGTLDAQRDWIHAHDVAMAAWLTLQQANPDDYIISLGDNHTVREFIEKSFDKVGITIEWKGTGIDEIGYDRKTGRTLIKVNHNFFRKYEANAVPIKGINTKLCEIGWKPKYSLDDIIDELVHQ